MNELERREAKHGGVRGEGARSRRYDVTRVILDVRAMGGGETAGKQRWR